VAFFVCLFMQSDTLIIAKNEIDLTYRMRQVSIRCIFGLHFNIAVEVFLMHAL